ncbi:peptidoglycan/LPS O-acetylase OafA/YrhL [Pseudarthrobacter oxydans]|uniref:Peptidoglycan/LPS O-acetylase OafA/YrhL n=1 Tax=Pseudarthrobacter oxydans TaxID=1671 RepID=A0AAW8N6I4_PSEOX|nr:acyltransferase [Pseudarthrobacter oxydans]MDR6790965.1 peptidoglycan/LPS O-acetylase OafA/YrhL [Pseudarthrobacter oxydans]MDR7162606.1 peptidoglycan/LPS O-acetylase OafA/YrhL [Pseudarthrobacter oxydans]
MSSGETAVRNRIEFLDAVRGVAASLVVFHHLMVNISPEYRWFGHTFFDPGRIGVVAFFLVSGYVIPLSLRRGTQNAFWIKRFFRLFPVYWVAFALYFAVAHKSISDAPLWVWGMNFLMLNGLLGLVSILPPAWTLSIELLFYIQSSTARLRGVLDRTVHFGWLWLVLFLALAAGSRALEKDLPLTLPLLMFCAALGHSLYLRDHGGSRIWRYLLGAGLVLGPVGTYVRGHDGEWAPLTYSLSFILGLCLFLVFYLLQARSVPNALKWLGGISYSLYLFHITITHTFHDLLGLDGPLYFMVGAAASVGIAHLAHRYVEKPFNRLGHGLSRTRIKAAIGASSS